MANFLKIIFRCLPCLCPGGTRHGNIKLDKDEATEYFTEKAKLERYLNEPYISITTDEAASRIVTAMATANKVGLTLEVDVQTLVHQAGGWSEYLARKILVGLEIILKEGKQLSPAMQTAYMKACEAAKATEGFEADHPIATAVFCTVIAIGVLVYLAPVVLEVLGFAELGPVEGVSLYSFFPNLMRRFVDVLISWYRKLGCFVAVSIHGLGS